MQNHSSLYRVYRPSTFKDVAGHQNIVEILTSELKKKTFVQAYLFAGQRGTGKTSIARILAKALNCLDLQNGNPCDQCQNCLSFNANQFPDIYEIDAASNNGVDEIRNIKNNVQTLPIIGNYKVYIIDEVHMLTKGAFNALLKTLEEPPKHIVFILATTEFEKIPQTIVSRCQTFNFKKISDRDLKKRSQEISQKEGYVVEDDVLDEIYNLSEGSLRDALNVLEQLMVVSNDKTITLNDLKKIFYIATKDEKVEIINDILENKSAKIITYFEKNKDQGMDFNNLALSLIKIIKEIIEYKITNNAALLAILDAEDLNQFSKIPLNKLFEISDSLTEAYIRTKNNTAGFDYILLSILKTIDGEKTNTNLEIVVKEPIIVDEVKIEVKKEEPHKATATHPSLFERNIVKDNPKVVETKKTMESPIGEKIIPNISNHQEIKQTLITPLNIVEIQNESIARISEATLIQYSIEEMINVLMGVLKDQNSNLRHDLNDKVQDIFELNENKTQFLHQELAANLSFLFNTNIVAANNNEAIIVSETPLLADYINLQILDDDKRETLFKLLGNSYLVYAIPNGVWRQTKNNFASLKQKGFLPEYQEKNLDEFYKRNKAITNKFKDPKNKELLEKASQLFDLNDINFGDN